MEGEKWIATKWLQVEDPAVPPSSAPTPAKCSPFSSTLGADAKATDNAAAGAGGGTAGVVVMDTR